MRAGKRENRDSENYQPVAKTGFSYRLGNHWLWAVIELGKTIVLSINPQYTNFVEVYQKELTELPTFLSDFFGLVDLNYLKRLFLVFC
jgi:hypothetical protein